MFEFPAQLLSISFSFLWVWMKSEVYKRNVETGGEVLARILDSSARIKKL